MNREELLQDLDATESVLVSVYRLMLGLVVAAVIAVVALVIIWRPWGAGNQGEWFYFAVAVLMVLGWAVGQFIKLDRRRRRRQTSSGTWTFQIRIGPAAGESHRNAEMTEDAI
jgi:hypothetical protein